MAAVDITGTAPAGGGEGRLLEVENLRVEVSSEGGWIPVVEDVNLVVGRQEIVGLVGESGSGKSLTAMSIPRLLPRSARIGAGTVTFKGTDLARLPRSELQKIRGREVGVIFQEPMSSLNPAFTVGEQIGEVVRRHEKVSARAAMARAVEMLDVVGVPSARQRAKDYPHNFSGGMCQRAMIALALACNPSLLIADEPTTALDVTIQAEVLDLLSRLRQEFELSVLLITHDLGVVATMCERTYVMYAGQIVEQAATAEMFAAPMSPYTEGLILSLPHVSPEKGRMGSIPGRVPRPEEFPVSCRFQDRCGYSQKECADAPIPLQRRDGRFFRCIRSEVITLAGVGT